MILRAFFILSLLFNTIFAMSAETPITPIENVNDYNVDKAILGKKLFFDTRLSRRGFSCNTCHTIDIVFTGTSKTVTLPVPTILNADLNYYFGVNGQFSSLEEAIKSVIADPKIYDSTPDFMLKKIRKNPIYMEKFKEIYGGLNYTNVIDALSEFVRALKTPSRFDKFLLGDDEALSDDEKEGYRLFIQRGCISCHNGKNIGNGLIVKLKRKTGEQVSSRVPTLRNILRTPPYMRINSPNIYAAIMWLKNSLVHFQLNYDELDKIVTFFESLNGEVPAILRIDDEDELRILMNQEKVE